jgi:hypothetical protein
MRLTAPWLLERWQLLPRLKRAVIQGQAPSSTRPNPI